MLETQNNLFNLSSLTECNPTLIAFGIAAVVTGLFAGYIAYDSIVLLCSLDDLLEEGLQNADNPIVEQTINNPTNDVAIQTEINPALEGVIQTTDVTVIDTPILDNLYLDQCVQTTDVTIIDTPILDNLNLMTNILQGLHGTPSLSPLSVLSESPLLSNFQIDNLGVIPTATLIGSPSLTAYLGLPTITVSPSGPLSLETFPMLPNLADPFTTDFVESIYSSAASSPLNLVENSVIIFNTISQYATPENISDLALLFC